MLSVDMENKENGSVGVKNSMENGRPPDPADWAVMDVVNYFRTAGFEEQASAFQEQLEAPEMLKIFYNIINRGSGNSDSAAVSFQSTNIWEIVKKSVDDANNKKIVKRIESKTDKEETI